MRTQVGIIASGPSGLLLARLLHRAGIETVVLESRSREYVLGRIRAGVLEQGMADLSRLAGVGERMDREGLVHQGSNIAFDGRLERLDLHQPTGGKSVLVYGQTDLKHDLMVAHIDRGDRTVHYEVPALGLEDADTEPHALFSNTTARGRCLPAISWRAVTATMAHRAAA